MSFSYQTTTIGELMSQIDSLGGTSRVKMSPTHLTALVNNNPKIQHYQEGQRNYLLLQNNKKKYFYDSVAEDINMEVVRGCMEQFQEGFNVTIVLYGNMFKDLIKIIHKPDEQAISHFLYPLDPSKPIVNLIEEQTKTKSDYYQWDKHLKIEPFPNDVTLTKIISRLNSTSQLKIIALTNKAFEQSSQCKSQLLQLVDSLNKNPHKSGKEIANRLFTKKHKIVSMFLDNVFNDSLNYLVHDCSITNQGIFEFCNKFRGLSNFSIRGQESIEQTVVKLPIKHSNTNCSTSKTNLKTLQKKQLHYCRSLERKTHKYSIKPHQNQSQQMPTQQTIPTKHRIFLSPQQQIQVLKSQHSVEISKYHQTIQSLNAKLLILQQQNNVQELCNVYEKQIMHLELKIQELRSHISGISGNSNDSLKLTIKKLNEQIIMLQSDKSLTSRKTQRLLIPKANQIKSLEVKLKESNDSRSQLIQQLKIVTQRLQIRQKQIKQLNSKISNFGNLPEKQKQSLSVSAQQQLSQLNTLLNELNKGNGSVYIFIKNKINNLFMSLGFFKDIILESNSFLVELQKLLENKIGDMEPEIVLNCNRFIRGFLMKCIEVEK